MIGQAYRFSPGGTDFRVNRPAVCEIKYDREALKARGLSEDSLKLYYFNEETNKYVAVPSRVDSGTGKIIATVEHFTVYVPMAQAYDAGNNAPDATILDTVPNPIRAGAPIYVRAQVRDHEAQTNNGAIASVKLEYRKLNPGGSGTPGPWQTAIMQREITRNSMDVYGFLIPASFLQSADLDLFGDEIEFRVEAMDNLAKTNDKVATTVSINVNRQFQTGTLSFDPTSQDITAGYERNFTLMAKDNFNIDFVVIPETFFLTEAVGELKNQYALGIQFKAESRTNTAVLEGGFGSESAQSNIRVFNGQMDHIEILDENGLVISGPMVFDEGITYTFDAVAHDEFDNKIVILPQWSADPIVGTIDGVGEIDTSGCSGAGEISISDGPVQ